MTPRPEPHTAPSRCNRIALLMNAQGKKKKYPIPDDAAINDVYWWDGVPWTVVLVTHATTIEDLQTRLAERVGALTNG